MRARSFARVDPLKLARHCTIFDQKWKAIVDGTSTGVDGTLDQLAKLRQGIADYLKGLSISDLSPLSPTERLHEAQSAYVDELTKAQSGDLTALGDITKFADAYLKQARDFYASAPAYTDIFNAIESQLGDLAHSTPTGLPLPTTPIAAIDGHLPAGSLASQADVQENTQATKDLEATLAQLLGAGIQLNAQNGENANQLLQRLLAAQSRTPATAR